ncbi:MAG: hypothetical protein WA055_01970 [Candidatus Moraniibacteriota bacterium]
MRQDGRKNEAYPKKNQKAQKNFLRVSIEAEKTNKGKIQKPMGAEENGDKKRKEENWN